MQIDAARPTIYDIDGRHWMKNAPGFAEAVADAFDKRLHPRCMCRRDQAGQGIEMYVARLMDGHIVKRMPNTGSQHSPWCPTYEPPAEYSGLGQLMGTAIVESPVTGVTTLKLDFPLAKMPGRSQMQPSGGNCGSVASAGTRLSLRGLLHYLWDQAEMTRWQPGFAGRRSWATVRRHLLQAAEHKLARGTALQAQLYVPEPFVSSQRDAINARRQAHWKRAATTPGRTQHLMLLVGEVKEIVPARYGFKAIIKHVPDIAFSLDRQLYRRLGNSFERELTLWGAADDVQMLMIATFSVSAAGVPAIVGLALMPVTRQWIPVEDAFEKQLIERLVAGGRSFIKGLRYNLTDRSAMASAILTDCKDQEPLLFVVPVDIEANMLRQQIAFTAVPVWVWHPSTETMPPLPTFR